VQAAGELVAMAEKKKEDPDPIWKALESTWGIDVKKIRDYAVPDVSNSSMKDIVVKFSRKSSHVLHGFNSRAPAVDVSFGSYNANSIPESLMFDSHKLYSSMRWIGEYLFRYSQGCKSIDDTILYLHLPKS